jgi:hypothetical protein
MLCCWKNPKFHVFEGALSSKISLFWGCQRHGVQAGWKKKFIWAVFRCVCPAGSVRSLHPLCEPTAKKLTMERANVIRAASEKKAPFVTQCARTVTHWRQTLFQFVRTPTRSAIRQLP